MFFDAESNGNVCFLISQYGLKFLRPGRAHPAAGTPAHLLPIASTLHARALVLIKFIRTLETANFFFSNKGVAWSISEYYDLF